MSKLELHYGDCLELMKFIPDKSINLILVDPPYGVTNCDWDIELDLDLLWNQYNRIIKDRGVIVIFGIEPFSSKVRLSNLKFYKYDWIWQKTTTTGHLNANKQPLRAYENIMVFYKKQPKYFPQKTKGHKPTHTYTKRVSVQNNTELYRKMSKELSGGGSTERFPINILNFKSDKQLVKLHPTQKPISLLEYLIKTYTEEEDTVFDSCMGSCSTGEACKNLNRNFIGHEKDYKYFNISVNRILEKSMKEGTN